MQILKINTDMPNNCCSGLNVNKNNNCVSAYCQNSFQKINSFYGRDLISFGILKAIPITEISSRTIRDQKYIKALAKAIQAPVENLKSIIGIDEFKLLMKKATKENFDPKSIFYMINTHNHTVWSDGKAKVKEILDEAQQRGMKSGKNFLIGITDHDCLNSAREAIKLISESPEKYNNIRFMVGIEPCLKYENNAILKMPIPFDAVGYCINPFDEITRRLFETATETNISYAKTALQKVNERWGTNATFEDACKFHPLIKTGGSSGFLKYTKKYVEKVLHDAGIEFKPEEVLELFKPYYASQNGRATIATTNVIEASKVLKQSGYGEIGIAHPAIIEFNPFDGVSLDFTSGINLQNGIEYNDAVKMFLKTCGVTMIEGHYQYPQKLFQDYPQFQEIINIINESIKELKMTETGGTDSHGNVFGKILESRY